MEGGPNVKLWSYMTIIFRSFDVVWSMLRARILIDGVIIWGKLQKINSVCLWLLDTQFSHAGAQRAAVEPKNFSETVRIEYDVRQQVPVPEIVGGACQGQKISIFTGAQCRFRPAVPRPLYEQPDDKQGCDGAKRSEDGDMPWAKRQNWISSLLIDPKMIFFLGILSTFL